MQLSQQEMTMSKNIMESGFELTAEELESITGGDLFGAIVGGAVGGLLGSVGGPLGNFVGAMVGSTLGSAAEDHVNNTKT